MEVSSSSTISCVIYAIKLIRISLFDIEIHFWGNWYSVKCYDMVGKDEILCNLL